MRRGVGLGATVVAVVGIVVCLVLVVGVWLARGSVIERVDTIVGTVDRHLVRADVALGELSRTIESVRGRVQQLQARAVGLAQNGPLDGPAIDALTTAVDRQIGDDLRSLREGYVSFRERVEAAADSADERRRLLPFLRVPDLKTEVAQALDRGMDELEASVRELRASLDDRQGPLDQVAQRIALRLERLDERIGALSTAVTTVQARLSEARDTLPAAEAAVAQWVTVATVVLTLLFAWGAFLHVVLFAQGRAWVRTPPPSPQMPAPATVAGPVA